MKTDPELRSLYSEYIAKGIRYAIEETKHSWPDEWYIVTKSYSPLARFHSLLGVDIVLVDMPSIYELFIAFPARGNYNRNRSLQKSFLEFVNMNEIELN